MIGREYTLQTMEIGPTALARKLGVTRGAIYQWDHVPPGYCVMLAAEDRRLKLHRMNPEVYPLRIKELL